MRLGDPSNDPSLRQTKNGPGRKQHDVLNTEVIPGEADRGIDDLQAGEDAKNLPNFKSAAFQRVMKMIAARQKR